MTDDDGQLELDLDPPRRSRAARLAAAQEEKFARLRAAVRARQAEAPAPPPADLLPAPLQWDFKDTFIGDIQAMATRAIQSAPDVDVQPAMRPLIRWLTGAGCACVGLFALGILAIWRHTQTALDGLDMADFIEPAMIVLFVLDVAFAWCLGLAFGLRDAHSHKEVRTVALATFALTLMIAVCDYNAINSDDVQQMLSNVRQLPIAHRPSP